MAKRAAGRPGCQGSALARVAATQLRVGGAGRWRRFEQRGQSRPRPRVLGVRSRQRVRWKIALADSPRAASICPRLLSARLDWEWAATSLQRMKSSCQIRVCRCAATAFPASSAASSAATTQR